MNPQYQEQEVWTELQTCKQSHLSVLLKRPRGACYHKLLGASDRNMQDMDQIIFEIPDGQFDNTS